MFKCISQTMILVLLITASFSPALIHHSAATTTTILSVTPPVYTGLEIDDSFTINITITDVTDLYGWEFKLFYKSSVLNGTGRSEGPFLKEGGAQTFFQVAEFTDTYNSTHGLAYLAATRIGTEKGVNGSGTLAAITFKAIAYGDSPLKLIDTKLVDSVSPFGNLIPHETSHGRVHVGLVDVAIIKIDAPISIPAGTLALINVTVENQGIVPVTSDVSLYYNGTPIGVQTVHDLAAGNQQILTYPWDTIPIPIGDYRLTANATILPGEIDIEDNFMDAGMIYVGRRDIAVANTHMSKNVTSDTIVYINVTVSNNGEAAQTFNVTVYFDTTPRGTKTNVTLQPGTSTPLVFAVNTTPIPYGVYTISIHAAPVPGETHTADNTLIVGTITETITGDVDGNFEVNIIDISKIAVAWQSTPGDPHWNPNADLDNNNIINIVDLTKAAVNFGQSV